MYQLYYCQYAFTTTLRYSKSRNDFEKSMFSVWECHYCPGSPLARASNTNNKLLIVFQLGSHHQECPGPSGCGYLETRAIIELFTTLSLCCDCQLASNQGNQAVPAQCLRRAETRQRGWKVFNLVSIWQRLAPPSTCPAVSGPNVVWRQR